VIMLMSGAALFDNAVGELADSDLAADFSTPSDQTVSAMVSEPEDKKKQTESERLDAIDALWAEAAAF